MSITHSIEVAFTDFTARHGWKWIRPLVKRHLALRCSHCLLSTHYTTLNSEGICPYCVEWSQHSASAQAAQQNTADSQAALDRLMATHAGKTPGAYDAVILMSGGKDSAYLLHRIRKEYPELRLLSIMVDNGFMSPHAISNLHEILGHFDVPHISVQPQPSFVKKVFRYTLTHLHLQKDYSIVDLMDGHMTFDHAKNFAASMGIPIVLCGMSHLQAEMLYGEPVAVESPRAIECTPVTEHAGIPLQEFGAENMAYWFDGSQWPAERVPHFVLPFTVWNVSEEEVLAAVTSLGFISKQKVRPLVTNNALIPVIGMAEVAKFGYCYWEVEFARMVREGKSDRTYWVALFEMLEFSTKTGRFVNKTVVETLARLGLTKKDIGIG